MVTFFLITSTGGRLGRIHWANTAPFRGGTIWGQLQWDKLWPKKPEDVFSERMQRIAKGVRSVGEQMNQVLATVKQAENAFTEFGRAVGAAAVKAGKIDSPYIFDTSLKEIKKSPHR
jgi:hypothetical protein